MAESEVFWELLNSKGKPGKTLKVSGRTYRYQNARLPVGTYTVVLSTNDIRAVLADVQVVSVRGKKLVNQSIDVRKGEETATFQVTQEDTPAAIVIQYSIRLPGLLGIKLKTKITRSGSQEIGKDLNDIYREVLFETLNKRTSREQVMTEGLIRPYLFLLSMHPSARAEVAKYLGVSLKKAQDPQSEVMMILYKGRKGMVERTKDSLEKVTSGSKDDPNWFRMLQRAAKEGFGKSIATIESTSRTPLAEDGCRNSSNPLLHKMEIEFLEKIAELLLKKMDKESLEKLDALMKEPDDGGAVEMLFRKLDAAGMDSETIKKFALSMYISSTGSDDSLSTDDLMNNLHEKLLKTSDPTPQGAKTAGKVAKVGLKVALKCVLMTVVPVIGVAFMATMIASHVLGSSHDVVLVVIINILLQKLLLVVQDVRIENFY